MTAFEAQCIRWAHLDETRICSVEMTKHLCKMHVKVFAWIQLAPLCLLKWAFTINLIIFNMAVVPFCHIKTGINISSRVPALKKHNLCSHSTVFRPEQAMSGKTPFVFPCSLLFKAFACIHNSLFCIICQPGSAWCEHFTLTRLRDGKTNRLHKALKCVENVRWCTSYRLLLGWHENLS